MCLYAPPPFAVCKLVNTRQVQYIPFARFSLRSREVHLLSDFVDGRVGLCLAFGCFALGRFLVRMHIPCDAVRLAKCTHTERESARESPTRVSETKP